MEVFAGVRLTDRWYPVKLVDSVNLNTPILGVVFGGVTVGYGYEGAGVEVAMPVLIGDWSEQGGGNYWLQMGLVEFANFGKYMVRVYPTVPNAFAIRTFIVESGFVEDISDTVHNEDLSLHIVGNTIGRILPQLEQSEFEQRNYIQAVAPVAAQNITAGMVAAGCVQYITVLVSYTRNFAAPDYTYYILFHYDAQRRVDQRKASLGIVW